MPSLIAVTGASGTLGRLVADELLAAVDPAQVVLLSRDPAKLEARGAQTRRADFQDAASLPAAFADVETLLLISTDVVGADRVAGHRTAIDAAKAAGVRRVVYTSLPDPSDSNPAAVAVDHRQTEDHLRASGLEWTFLRNSIYTEMLVPTVRGAAASGAHVTNIGAGATAYVSRADCAAVAVAVLTQAAHAGKAYDVTGPEALDAEAQAALFAELTGTAVAVTHLDDAAWVQAMVAQAGLPEPVAEMLATFGAATRRGYLDTVSPVVRDLTGREPASARDALAAALA